MKGSISAFLATALSTVCFGDILTVDDDGKADFSTIQAAVDAANSGDVIEVMPGTYTSTSTEVVEVIYENFEITLRSSDPSDPAIVATTIIDGEGVRRGIVCESPDTGLPNTITIDGFTITNCFNKPSQVGAGVHCYASSPSISNCIITNNISANNSDGGGIGLYNCDNGTTITNCTFDSNSAEGHGGGLYNDAGQDGAIALINCTFTNNSATITGGGIYSKDQEEIYLEGCTFTNNTANYAGGMYTDSYSSTTTVINCAFTNNTAQAGYGGGMYSRYQDETYLEGCTFQNNIASSSGGGLYLLYTTPTLLNCDFIDNGAKYKGYGMHLEQGIGLVMDGCTFTGNQQSEYYNYSGNAGGGASVSFDHENGEEPRTISDCTFENNSTRNGKGGGLSIGGSTGSEVIVDQCSFIENGYSESNGSTSDGGGLLVTRSASILNCTFQDNYGSQIYVGDVVNIDLCDFIISEQSAISSSTAIKIWYADTTIANSIFTNSREYSPYAHQIRLYSKGSYNTSVIGCTFQDTTNSSNTSDYSYCIDNNDGGTLLVSNCTISNNRCGGVSSYNSLTIIEDCTIVNNRGTGVLSSGEDNTADITNSVITHNSGNGLLLYGGTVSLEGTQLCSNWPTNISDQGADSGYPTTLIDLGGNNLNANCDGEGPFTILVPEDYSTIGEALNNAFEGDEIIVGPGTYNEINLTPYASVYIHGIAGASKTIIDAKGMGRIMTLGDSSSNETIVLTIEGFTFKNGFAGEPDEYGGVWGQEGNGGAVIIEQPYKPHFVDCVFENNTSNGGRGGAIYFQYWNNGESIEDVRIDGCEFINNRATINYYQCDSDDEAPLCEQGGWAGAIYFDIEGVDLLVADCLFDLNIADQDSGGINLIFDGGWNEESDHTASFTNCIFSHNEASSGSGGAMSITSYDDYYSEGSSFIFNDCTFDSNIANGHGGGLELSDWSSSINLTAISCTFSNNSADYGGGIFGNGMVWSDPHDINLLDCTFNGNSAQTRGGAVHCGPYAATTTATDSIFSGNIATIGGAIYVSSPEDNEEGTLTTTTFMSNNCEFNNNEAFYGGAIYGTDWPIGPAFNTTAFQSNKAVFGGGIYNNAGYLAMDNCEFFDNEGEYGGGIYNRLGILEMSSSNFSGNMAYQGGAMFGLEAIASISGSAFGSNMAEQAGGAIYNQISYTEFDSTLFCSNDPDHIFGAYGGDVVFSDVCDDCNGNGIADWADLSQDPSIDCDGNLVIDSCEITDGSAQDCNNNLIPDSCDFENGTSSDCNTNEIPDECEDDCDENGVPDECDIANGTDSDCNNNNIPDGCDPDCNGNGIPDDCDPEECPCLGDCNSDGIVDVLDVLIVIAYWGLGGGGDADINNDGDVGVADILILIAAWGPCE